ncbi:XdhC family protein (plasmid) [Paracoccus yeei]|uniref:XdhC family protein n=1 Tax=Paracoccus yeei TaxID=147645 RepID=A0A1V0GZ81_9RHOB|nr:XdhC family protein [Paracoccus yeei]ARC39174.1 XdhC family protein [Paracoccus yeei]
MARGGDMALTVTQSDLPLDHWQPGAVLALITGTEGPAYRRAGAGMLVLPDGARVGHLSAGCIDRDVALHAATAARTGLVRHLRYVRIWRWTICLGFHAA